MGVLRRVDLLDVRSEAMPPIQDSVHIPLAELGERTHELARRDEPVYIADTGEVARLALQWLEANGRSASLRSEFSWGDPGRGRLWSPNPFLEDVLPLLPRGRALDMACGSGRDAVFLASAGFDVTAIDHLEDALDLGRDLERRYGNATMPVEWLCQDLERVGAPTKFDLVSCFWYLHRPLLIELPKVLNADGHFVMETFTAVHRERFGKPKTERFVLREGELAELVAPLTVRQFEEGWHGDRHTARIWAQLI